MLQNVQKRLKKKKGNPFVRVLFNGTSLERGIQYAVWCIDKHQAPANQLT